MSFLGTTPSCWRGPTIAPIGWSSMLTFLWARPEGACAVGGGCCVATIRSWTMGRLREMAGTLSRRLRAFCDKRGIPVIEAQSGERKHELAEPHLPADPKFCGVFLVVTGNAPAPGWEVKRNAARRIIDVRHRK